MFDFVNRPAISHESWNDAPFLIFAMNHRLSQVCFQDLEDAAAAAAIARVLASLGMSRLAVAVRSRSPLGNGVGGGEGGEFGLKLSVQSAEVGRRLGDAHAPPPIDPAGPRHGEWDGAEHLGDWGVLEDGQAGDYCGSRADCKDKPSSCAPVCKWRGSQEGRSGIEFTFRHEEVPQTLRPGLVLERRVRLGGQARLLCTHQDEPKVSWRASVTGATAES